MIIEEKDFRLIPIDEHTPFFNLELLYTVRPRGGETRQEFKNVGYGLSLDNAIKHIIQYRLSCKYENVDLITYFNEFRNELESLKKYLNYE